ncbi:alpha/beta hydrolase [Mucilaginibacter sp. HC2]|uniref:alpha/beta fold hydrolase n=1 Tax=Mucilaginibacter inviolabilis TaxID=2714892 RepID=UPI00140C6F4B|nr:alpha/beta hydrolase [Mucilaginibacter inviolabilis]NHA03392.1 alpha/beta hydrolase [Mucilaginibacter inviolabilis]
MNTTAQKAEITTSIGKISVYIQKNTSDKLPIIFLHGIYFDHHLWNKHAEEINDRTVIAVDMPFHGDSRENIEPKWTLNDCANMLMEILDNLQISKVIAVGHSWGSMTILRAAHRQPTRFESVGLCNMSFKSAAKSQRIASWFQHSMLVFRNFYINQSAKTLFGKASLKENPALANELKRSMGILSNRQIKHIDKAVMMDAEDATYLIKTLKVDAIALRGEEDFVPTPPHMETILVKGGHISPLERPLEVSQLISRLMAKE